jgi:hypothetical protein
MLLHCSACSRIMQVCLLLSTVNRELGHVCGLGAPRLAGDMIDAVCSQSVRYSLVVTIPTICRSPCLPAWLDAEGVGECPHQTLSPSTA